MSNDEREPPEFDDLDLPEEDLPQPAEDMFGPAEEMLPPDEDMAEPSEEMFQPGDETLQPSDDTTPAEASAEDAVAEPFEAPLSAAGPDEVTGEDEEEKEEGEEEEEEEEKEEKEGLLAKLQQADPYMVMLAISLAAILISILCLFFELRTYNSDIKAEEAKQRVGMMPAVQSGPPSTTAAA